MRIDLRLASATAFMFGALATGHANAASPGPDPIVVAQAGPRPAPPARVNDSASGISPNPSNDTTGVSPLTPDIPLPTSAPPRVGLFPETGRKLLDLGIDIHGTAFDHFIGNPNSGITRGEVANVAVFSPAVDIDLQRLAGVPGANIHIQGTFFGFKADVPQILTKAGGFLTSFQDLPNTQTQILSVLTYEQKLFNDNLSFEVGRTNPYRFFFLPNSLDPFTHFSSTVQIDGDITSNPNPVWGGRATYHMGPALYVQGGLFEDDYRRATGNGNNFGTTANSGFLAIGELGYRTEFNTAAYPANFEVGALFDERHGSVTNLKGTGIPYSKRLGAPNYGNAAVLFAQGLKVLYRGDKPAYGPPQNISVYGSADVSLDKPQPIDFDAIIGVNFTGFIPGRTFDALGLQAHYQRLSSDEANRETTLERLGTGRGSIVKQPRNALAFEAVGNIQLTSSIALRPFVQYFVNPDGYYNPAPHLRPRDGFEAGVFGTIALGRLLGTSEKPF